MKPIAQTFTINEAETGVEAVFVTDIDLYFQKKSSTYGVELQIREVTNGYPTQTQLPYGSKILAAANVAVSSDASVGTRFTFETPVLVRTNEQFAIVVVPVAGNPDYVIWSGVLGQTDTVTKAPIFTTNELGSLFISSNDKNFTPIQSESMKYSIRIANFTASSGTVVYTNAGTDMFSISDERGSFATGEQVVVSNNTISLASITSAAAFTGGEIIVQPNTATTIYDATAYGTLAGSEGGRLVLKDVGGSSAFSNTGGGLKGLSSAVTTANFAGAPYLNVSTYSNTTILVPSANATFATDFVVNNFLYVGNSTRSYVQVVKIASVDAANRKVIVSANVNFTDSAAIIGRVRANDQLFGFVSSKTNRNAERGNIILSGVTSDSSKNFANSKNQLLIGRSTGASARINTIVGQPYHSITPQISSIVPKQTSQEWTFKGTTAGSLQVDSSASAIVPDVPFEFVDKARVILSMSSEYATPTSGGVGSKSLTVTGTLSTANSKISPYIDVIRNEVHLTRNVTTPEIVLSGFAVTIANSTNTFSEGDTVWQSNSVANTTATVLVANSTYILISNLVSSNTSNIPAMVANNTSVINNITSVGDAQLVAIKSYSDVGDFNINGSRYISKNVILADQQDAEDLICYLGAYRPQGTNFKVYGKFINGSDPAMFRSKDWSALVETSSPALISSLVNRDDNIELSYVPPLSKQVFNTGCVANSGAATIKVDSTDEFRPGMFIYFSDTTTGSFNVRKVTGVVNTTFMNISSAPSINTTSASAGYIPSLESQYGAFRYANNYGIVRYTTENDAVFDSYKTFAIKIVLTSDSQQIVPRMTDMRCLALQI